LKEEEEKKKEEKGGKQFKFLYFFEGEGTQHLKFKEKRTEIVY
jgi:hypothetical protein